MQDIRLIFNGWPDKINTMSSGFYQYQEPALDVSPDHVQVVCRHGHESVFNICQRQFKIDPFYPRNANLKLTPLDRFIECKI
jgi:hypothetical protein